MGELLAWIEDSALGVAVRESGVWTYGLINLTHILGVASLFGSVLILDLRLLGAWRSVALAALARPAVPIATAGFLVAATSGICLLATNATEYLGNAFFYIKFPAIALAIGNVLVLNTMPAWKARNTRPPSPREEVWLAVAGGISLLCWLTAVAAGRLIGYW